MASKNSIAICRLITKLKQITEQYEAREEVSRSHQHVSEGHAYLLS